MNENLLNNIISSEGNRWDDSSDDNNDDIITREITTQTGKYYILRASDYASATDLPYLQLWWQGQYITNLEYNSVILLRANNAQSQISFTYDDGHEPTKPLDNIVDNISLTSSDYRFSDPETNESNAAYLTIDSSNLIVNSSFEDTPDFYSESALFQQITGWQASEGSIKIQHNRSVGTVNTIYGEQALELDSGQSGSATHIFQDVKTQAGEQYELKLRYSPYPGHQSSSAVEIWWDNEKIATLSASRNVWYNHEFTVEASQNTTRLEFRGAGGQDGFGGYIDYVRLNRVDTDNIEPPLPPELTAKDDTFTIQEDNDIRINFADLLKNDIYDDTATIANITLADGMTGEIDINHEDGYIIYSPNAHFHGHVTLTYDISDSHEQTSSANITIIVESVNDAPIIVSGQTNINKIIDINEIFSLTLNPSDYFSDADNDILTYDISYQGNSALPYWLSLDSDKFIISGQSHYFSTGNHIFTITANDGKGGNASLDVTITVDDSNADIALNTLNGIGGIRITGRDKSEAGWTGWDVAAIGDVNGDGFDDMLVGAAWTNHNDRFYSGSAYIVFGQSGNFDSVIDLDSLDGSNGFAIHGSSAYDIFTEAVDGAGDVNGDGYDDIIIGAPLDDPHGVVNAGSAYLIYGQSSFAAHINIDNTDDYQGRQLYGNQYQSRIGFAVSDAGDVNGDGIADYAISSPRVDNNVGSDVGESYIIYGHADIQQDMVNLSDLSHDAGFTIIGGGHYHLSGYDIASAGDFNGDGIDDLLVNAVNATSPNNQEAAGKSYVIYGKKGGYNHDIDLSQLTSDIGFAINGRINYDYLGYSLDGIGDINGDGYDDIALGRVNLTINNVLVAGSTKVILGRGEKINSPINIDSDNTTNRMISVNGEIEGGNIGFDISGAGDFNGDGYDDFIVASPYINTNDLGRGAGAAYLVFGSADLAAGDTIGLEHLDNHGIKLSAYAAGQQLGRAVAGGSDINGDGFDDIILGAPYSDVGDLDQAGESYIIFGFDTQNSIVRHGTVGDDIIIAGYGDDTIAGLGGGDIIRAGAGDDIITVTDGQFKNINGGNGKDILTLDGGNILLNLAENNSQYITSIEQINLGYQDSGNTVFVSLSSLYNITEERDNGQLRFIFDGDNQDDIVFLNDENWDIVQDQQFIIGNHYYHKATLDNAEIFIQSDIVIHEVSKFDDYIL